MFAHFKKIASCNSMTRYPQIKEEPFSFGVLENWLMLGRDAPALRPLHPRSCRKRAFRQGQALRSRFAGDGRGSLRRGLGQRKFTTQRHKGNNTKTGSSPLTVLPHTDTRRERYIQTRPSVCSAEFSRYMHRDHPPGIQMFAPSCASC